MPARWDRDFNGVVPGLLKLLPGGFVHVRDGLDAYHCVFFRRDPIQKRRKELPWRDQDFGGPVAGLLHLVHGSQSGQTQW